MNDTQMDSLDQLIELCDAAVNGLERGSPAWEKAVNAAIRLRETKSDLEEKERAFMEKSERDADREHEYQLKVEQLEEQKRARRWECASKCIMEFLRLGTYVAGTFIGLCVEKDGMILFSTNKQSHSNCMRGK